MAYVEYEADGKTIKARVQQKTDTLANWMANDNIVLAGEQAFVVNDDGTPLNFKIGDGTKAFRDLPNWIDFSNAQRVSSVAPGVLPAGPAEETKYMEVTAIGTYTYGGNTLATITEDGYKATFWWTGTEWISNGVVRVKGEPGETPTGTDTLEQELIPKGKAVEKYVEPLFDDNSLFKQAIVDSFKIISENKIAGDSAMNVSSTFSGWGQNKGIQKDFNAVSYDVLPFNSSNVPTYVEMRIRDTNGDGAVLYTVRVEANFEYNVRRKTMFILPETVENLENKELFFQFNADGYIASIGSATGSPTGSLKYTTTKSASTVPASTSNASTLGLTLYVGDTVVDLSEEIYDNIETKLNPSSGNPRLNLTRKVWLYPTFEYNIFNKNVLIPLYGEDKDNYLIDYAGTVGKHFNRGYRLNPVTQSLNTNITLNLFKNGTPLFAKTQNLLSSTTSNGSGNTRKVLLIADSTGDNNNMTSPMKTIFAGDVMNVQFIGTRGAIDTRHEGRSGWTWNDYYGIGRVLYVVNVTGLSEPPIPNTVYTQGGVNYTVVEVNITGGNGYFSVNQTSGATRPLSATGTLTKVSGTGASTITYASSSTSSSNPFYNPSTSKFDIGYYLTQTSQSLSDGDIIAFQLGINDMFSTADQSDANARLAELIPKMEYIFNNINSYNPNIRIALVVTFPPASQDAFGANYNLGQNYETYVKIGLASLQERIVEVFDTDAWLAKKLYLIPAHLHLDTDYNFPSIDVAPNSRYTGNKTVNMQNNAVHPNADGYMQIAEMVAGLIKYFG